MLFHLHSTVGLAFVSTFMDVFDPIRNLHTIETSIDSILQRQNQQHRIKRVVSSVFLISDGDF